MKLIFRGIVQGVGFRPTIYRTAKNLGLKGYVLNKGSEVEVVIDKNPDKFIQQVKKHLPSTAQITDILKGEDRRIFDDFYIFHSKNGERKSLTPVDVSICNDCLEELFQKNNRRYHYPFTNCTICGARFSLIRDVPYDRERTSMDEFPLCEKCTAEYEDPPDRRYHAQTISCPICGPTYKLFDNQKNIVADENPIRRFAKQLNLGKIGVIKSWGGMHLCCRLDRIPRFREWYRRPQKPFAVMVKDIKTAKKYGKIGPEEEKLLTSDTKPIILVKKRQGEAISPGLDTIGLYLPYTGLHYILFSYLDGDAMVMTSANIPGEPMMTRNKEVFSLNADMYLLHNRSIPNRIDDSVIKIWKGNHFFIRKSRGFVPDPIEVGYNNQVLSVGAGENVSGAVSCDKKIYATQYIGNSEYYSTLEFLEQSLRHLMNLTMKTESVDAVVMDPHPGYNTRRVAKQFAEEFSAPLFEVQHHWAHSAALLVDKNVDESVVLTMDGLGYGSKGIFWGGEVFGTSFKGFERVGHLENIPLIGGDQATLDPRRLVFAIFRQFGKNIYFSGKEAAILTKMMGKAPQSSSLGRVLDALSFYLGVCKKRTYDGEPAMKLEKYLAVGEEKYYFDVHVEHGVVGTVDLFRQLDRIVKHPLSNKEKADISYSFVKTVVDSLVDIGINYAQDADIKTIGLTGGVSYNIPITEMVEKRVKNAGLKLLVHNRIPNGDGCIAIGQNAVIGYKLGS